MNLLTSDKPVEIQILNPDLILLTGLHDKVHSLKFDAFFTFLVVGNAFLTGKESMYTDDTLIPGWLGACDNCLLVMFVAEIFLRVRADTWIWFMDWMNLFDFSVILFTGLNLWRGKGIDFEKVLN